MLADEPPQLLICPAAYEVFASSEDIRKIEIIADRENLSRTGTTIEHGDVARLTIFVPIDRSDPLASLYGVSSPPQEIEDSGGRSYPSSQEAAGQECETPRALQMAASTLPDLAYFDVSGEYAGSFKKDLDTFKVNYKNFLDENGDTVFKIEAPNVIQDYRLQSVTYRLERGDYGEVVYAPGLSLTQMRMRKEAQVAN